jgi:hypothetical protein
VHKRSVHSRFLLALLAPLAALYGCSGTGGSDPATISPSTGGAGGEGGEGGEGGAGGDAGGAGAAGGVINNGGSSGQPQIQDPRTCAEAASSRSYFGCDFWPTVLDNIVRPDFDYAVIAANASEQEATVTVTRGDATIGTVTVPPGGLTKLFLPWVPELKGVDSISPGCPTNVKTSTVYAKGGAYRVTSSVPIALYQFNALQYAGKGGPAGKNWDSCNTATCFGQLANQCFSFTNDASLLLPSTAYGSTYRVGGYPSWSQPPDPINPGASTFTYPPYIAITATQAQTKVEVTLSGTASVAGGSGLADIPAGGKANFTLEAGDVVLLVGEGEKGVDLSGSLVRSSAPVQVLTGISCANIPEFKPACDHLEETLLPAETLGKRYFVTAPSGPAGKPLGHVVRIYGNVDGTKLSYPGANPGGPTAIDAGQVVELPPTFEDFEIVGDREFMVGTFQVGAGPVTSKQMGDPSQSFAVTVEQFRKTYVFLAPDDYDENYADVVLPMSAKLTLDGQPVTTAPTPLSSDFGVLRIKLGPGQNGAHTLSSDQPVGLQVLGYGTYTSYQYPGGLNLGIIAPPPIK